MSDFYTLSDDDQAERLTDLAKAALSRWGGQFEEPRLFKYRENAIFSVHHQDGSRRALRIHRANYHSDEALRSELHFMRELDRAGVAVPQVIPASDGSLFVEVRRDGVPEPRQVDMLAWLSGTSVPLPEGDASAAAAYYFELGQLAARLHRQGSAITLPGDFVRHSWDEEGLLGSDPVWGRFWELPTLTSGQRALLVRARDMALGDLAAFGKSAQTFGMIHADLIRDNVLRSDGGLQAIDFDDCGFGWYMFEIATILCSILDHPDYPELRERLFAGYTSQRPLSDGEAARLPLFMFLRASTYVGWIQTRSETQTAREMGPKHVARCCRLAADYLGFDK